MGTTVFQIDAFTDRPFSGNPAGVCVLPGPRDEGWMQAVAAEMNVSETAFLWPERTRAGEEGSLRLRWFTPAVEVDLCGHATLASAHVLWETGRLARGERARFETRSGRLGAVRRGDRIEMDFPADPPAETWEPTAAGPPSAARGESALAADLARALGATPLLVARGKLHLLALLESEEAVVALAPDFEALATFEVQGVIATALPGGSRANGADFVSRYFAPRAGVPEDPATGSAHCMLGPFWAERLEKRELTGYQASRRGGWIGVRVGEGAESGRVFLSGRAVTVMRCELLAG